jgi:hypothetical protein
MGLRAIVSFLIMMSIGALFLVKSNVQKLSKEISSIEAKILVARENLHILKAEFTNLSKPRDVEELAKLYLNLDTMRSYQLINIEAHKNSKTNIIEQPR